MSRAEGIKPLPMDIANNGDIYVACQYHLSGDFMQIGVYRSQDGGTTWTLWGEVTTPPGQGDSFTAAATASSTVRAASKPVEAGGTVG